MTKRTFKQAALLAAVACALQACALPAVDSRTAELALPEHFAQAESSGPSAAAMDWSSFFQDPQLRALIDTALENNKEANILLQRVARAANEVEARRGEYLPFLGVGAAAESEKVGRYTRAGAVEESLDIREGEAFPEPLRNLELGLRASWELDVWHKLRNATQAAALDYLASVEGRNFLLTNLVAEVAESYYELLALDNQLELLNRAVELRRSGLDMTRELQAFGRTSSLAVNRFEAELSGIESERQRVRQRIVAGENRLNLLLGRPPQRIERARSDLLALEPRVVEAGLPSELLENRPDIRRAELELAARALDVAAAKADFYPSFTIRAGAGFEAFAADDLLETPASLMYSLSGDVVAPLLNRRAIAARYRDASAEQIEAVFEYEQAVLRAYGEVATGLAELDSLARVYELKRNQVDSLDASAEVANQLFTAARADYLEVLLAQREALEARSELIETRQQQLSAMVDLYRALGGGWR